MSHNPPGHVPDNAFTRLQGELSGVNAGGGRVGVASATPMPTVRSADLGMEQPLSDFEKAELDAKARAIGILPPDAVLDHPYADMQTAMDAGRPIPQTDPVTERMTARELLMQQPMRSPRMIVGAPSRLPDFNKVQSIDLVKGVVLLDGVEFAMPAKDVLTYRKYALRIAHSQITEKLMEARRPPRRPRRRKNGEARTTSTSAQLQREPARDRQEPQG